MNHDNQTAVQGKTERITVLLPSDLYEQICHDADQRLLSRSAVIREALVKQFRSGNGDRPS
jgi:metal-responsive CopG/Arc/MetJ family transcriptional regulator